MGVNVRFQDFRRREAASARESPKAHERGKRRPGRDCSRCGSEVEMIPLDGVGVISSLAPPEVEAWIQSEDLHHTMAADGDPLICLNSMLKRIQKKGPA